jgi:hypothetical protein
MEGFVERYLSLGLGLGKLIPGLVDSYYGPTELSEAVDAEGEPDPNALAAEASSLLDNLGDAIDDVDRARWLRAQLVGLETVAQRLAGADIAYVDEVERCYGVRPELVPEEEFARAQEALDEVLPGTGPVRDRYEAWLEGHTVEPEQLLPVVERMTTELHERTAALVGLPEGESVELELVQNQPWLAFNYYLGDLRSRVVFCTDLPWRSTQLLDAVAHELYPGHHTEAATKEALLVRDRGWLEETAAFVGTPQCLVGEAIASIAREVVSGDDGVDGLTARLLEPFGLPYDPEQAATVRTHTEKLGLVASNVALLVHAEGKPLDEVREYARRWSLNSDARIEKGFDFILDPTWRAYAFCYTEGVRLGRGFVGDDPARFRQLVTEQLTPADLS